MLCCQTLMAQHLYFPPKGNNWDTLSPQGLNWCSHRIDSLYSFLDAQGTKSFIILKDGKIVLEKYFGTYTKDSSSLWYSAGKSLRALLIGIAQDEGDLSINDRTSDHIGVGWTNMPLVKEDLITVRHQLTMTSGIDETFFSCTSPICLSYKADAGTRWVYHNSPYNLLKDVLESATNTTINNYTKTRLKDRVGMGSGLWISGIYNSFFSSRARDMARFGLLMQNKGVWDTTTVLGDTAYFNQMVNTSQTLNSSYGYLWWLNGKSSFIPPDSVTPVAGAFSPDAPQDVITAAGSQGQFVSIAPSMGLVVVRQGVADSNALVPVSLHNEMWRYIMLLDCNSTSILQDSKAPNIHIYPNPIKGNKIIIESNIAISKLVIYDISGRVIKSMELKPLKKQQVSLSSIAKGLYIAEVYTINGERNVQRIAVQ